MELSDRVQRQTVGMGRWKYDHAPKRFLIRRVYRYLVLLLLVMLRTFDNLVELLHF